jgi:hypothetical protein
MLLAEELALLAVDPETGRHAMGTRSHLNATLAGLLVAELMLDSVAGPGRRTGEVVLVDDRPPAAPALAAAAAVVADKGPRIKAVLSHMSRGIESRLGYGTWEAALVALAEAGILSPARGAVRPTAEVLDSRPRQALVARLQAAAASDDPMDPRTALLLNMTGPASLLEVVAPERSGRRHARRRIDKGLDGTDFEPVGKAVRRVLADAAAAAGGAATGGAVVAGS